MAFLKTLRSVAISMLVITALLVLAGVLYVLFFGPHHVDTDSPEQLSAKQTTPFAAKTPAANAKEGVAIQTVTPTAAPGTPVLVVAITNATSHCAIKLDTSIAEQVSAALAPQVADGYGTVSWNIPISKAAKPGAKSLTISCVYNGRTGVVVGSFTVT